MIATTGISCFLIFNQTTTKPECCDKIGVCNPIATSFGDECGNVGCTKIGY